MKFEGIPGDTFIFGNADTLDKGCEEIHEWLTAPDEDTTEASQRDPEQEAAQKVKQDKNGDLENSFFPKPSP